MQKKIKKKKKLTLNEVLALKNVLSNFIETGFIELNDEESSRAIAKESLELIFGYVEDLKPRIRKKGVVLRGYEGDEIATIIYPSRPLTLMYDELFLKRYGYKPNYKTSKLIPNKIRLICQRMHIFLRDVKKMNMITAEDIVNRSGKLISTAFNSMPWVQKNFDIDYIEKNFDKIIKQVEEMKKDLQQQAEMLKGGF
jgi:hypothetical protein